MVMFLVYYVSVFLLSFEVEWIGSLQSISQI